MIKNKVAVVIPNWNGKKSLAKCLESLVSQIEHGLIIVVDNGSTDSSSEFVEAKFPKVRVIKNKKNHGFAGGVNPGIKSAMEQGYKYVALLNNDAVADKDWLERLCQALDVDPKAGIATSKIVSTDGTLDSTGEYYSIWGLPFPRGRGEKDETQYDSNKQLLGASGGASIYRSLMLQKIGLFDEDFFAYYEDMDIAFRANLYGWKVVYEPRAIVHHEIGATSGKIPGFTTYQTIKNLPQLFWKNVPASLLPQILPRFALAYLSIFISALARGQIVPAFKGLAVSLMLWPKKMLQRYNIQRSREVSPSYINSFIWHDLPPGPSRLKTMRKILTLGTVK